MNNLYAETINENTFLVGEINGYKCKNIKLLCNELRSVFTWPVHEKCIEAMYHIDWRDELNFKIIVNKFNSIKDKNQKDLISNELNNYKKHWDEKRVKINDPNKNIFLLEFK